MQFDPFLLISYILMNVAAQKKKYLICLMHIALLLNMC